MHVNLGKQGVQKMKIDLSALRMASADIAGHALWGICMGSSGTKLSMPAEETTAAVVKTTRTTSTSVNGGAAYEDATPGPQFSIQTMARRDPLANPKR